MNNALACLVYMQYNIYDTSALLRIYIIYPDTLPIIISVELHAFVWDHQLFRRVVPSHLNLQNICHNMLSYLPVILDLRCVVWSI